MSFLIDTNVISEVRKGDRCDPAVAAWWSGVAEDDLWLSALVLGEIRKGVELARRRDPRKADALEAWLGEVIPAEQARVVQLLVARVTVGDDGLDIDLRHEGLGALASLMTPAREDAA